MVEIMTPQRLKELREQARSSNPQGSAAPAKPMPEWERTVITAVREHIKANITDPALRRSLLSK